MKKLSWILSLSMIAACGGPKNSEDKPQEQTSNQKPNVIYIMADDHTNQAISAYGYEVGKLAPTPNIDRLASEGAILDNMFCTNSICGPSRSAILTGKFGHMSGFFKNVDGGDFDGSQMTFPKIFQANGYQTAVVGKWHLGTTPTGFDYSKVLINHGGQGTYYDPVFCVNGEDTIVEKGAYSTYKIADDFLDWLDNRDKEKPFMALYQFKAPHRPWRPAPDLEDLYEDVDFPEPDNFNDNYEGRPAAADNGMTIGRFLNRRDLKVWPEPGLSEADSIDWLNAGFKGELWSPHDSLKGQELKSWKYQRYIKDYLRCVAGVDKSVGRLLKYLDDNGLAENTIVIFSGDQGFYLGEHGWFDKRWMYEESFKMPFLIRWPKGIKAGSKISDMLMNIDYAPTFLDLAGLEIPEEIQGKSFAARLKGETETPIRNEAYYHYYEFPKWHHVQPHYGVRTERYKLIHFYYSMDVWELYDLQEDPKEMNNLYGKEGYEDITGDLKERIKKLQKEYKDDMTLEEMKKMTDVKIERVYHEPF